MSPHPALKAQCSTKLSYPDFELGTGFEPVTATPVVLTAELFRSKFGSGNRTHALQNDHFLGNNQNLQIKLDIKPRCISATVYTMVLYRNTQQDLLDNLNPNFKNQIPKT